jgi:O-acetyl-ADP-ribose deacetylase (regulator of RNase III)
LIADQINPLKLHLVDSDPLVVAAWTKAFEALPEVTIQCAELLSVAYNAVVSPANSYGFMDGGIDVAYIRLFGDRIETVVREAIARRPEGHLPVGAGLAVRTGHSRIPYLIVSPTMLMPEAVPSQNCYRAMRAVLRTASQDAEVSRAVFCPGLGTGVGGVSPVEAAKEMAEAFRDWKG